MQFAIALVFILAVIAGLFYWRSRVSSDIPQGRGETTGSYHGLRNAKLRNADLRYIEMRYGDVTGKSGQGLRNADMRGCDLSGAALTAAQMSGAYLTLANLEGATLIRADLRNADLRGANLRRASLSGALLEGARYNDRTVFPDLFDPQAQGMFHVPSAKDSAAHLAIGDVYPEPARPTRTTGAPPAADESA